LPFVFHTPRTDATIEKVEPNSVTYRGGTRLTLVGHNFDPADDIAVCVFSEPGYANGGVGGGATGGAEGAGGMAAAQGGDSTAVSSYLCKWAPSVVEAKNMTELRAELVRLGKTPVTSGSGKSAKVLKLDLVEQLLQFCKPKRLPRAPAAGVPLDIPTVDAPKREPNRPSNGPNADPTCPNDPGPTFLAVAPQLAAPPGARVSLSFGESGAEDDA